MLCSNTLVDLLARKGGREVGLTQSGVVAVAEVASGTVVRHEGQLWTVRGINGRGSVHLTGITRRSIRDLPGSTLVEITEV